MTKYLDLARQHGGAPDPVRAHSAALTAHGGDCIACGKCVRECPRELIRIHEGANPVVVKCSNKDPGKDARKTCEVSCIGCGICQKLCPAGAITVTDNLSYIDESVCLSCGQCAVKCPRHAIYDLRGILTEKR